MKVKRWDNNGYVTPPASNARFVSQDCTSLELQPFYLVIFHQISSISVCFFGEWHRFLSGKYLTWWVSQEKDARQDSAFSLVFAFNFQYTRIWKQPKVLIDFRDPLQAATLDERNQGPCLDIIVLKQAIELRGLKWQYSIEFLSNFLGTINTQSKISCHELFDIF